jgi:hypothetical protein
MKNFFDQFKLYIVTALICILVGFVLGFSTGKWAYQPATIVETARPAIILPPTSAAPHGAVIAARAPDSHAKPAQIIPKGDTLLRTGHATVASRPATDAQAAADKAAAPNCPPVRIDYSQVREKDGSIGMIVSSPDGGIIDAVDIPVAPILAIAHRPWAIGGSYGSGRDYGAWVDRDFGRIRIGAEINQVRVNNVNSGEARIRLGFTFGG